MEEQKYKQINNFTLFRDDEWDNSREVRTDGILMTLQTDGCWSEKQKHFAAFVVFMWRYTEINKDKNISSVHGRLYEGQL